MMRIMSLCFILENNIYSQFAPLGRNSYVFQF